MTDRGGECIRGMVGFRRVLETEEDADETLDLMFLRSAVADDCLFNHLGRIADGRDTLLGQ